MWKKHKVVMLPTNAKANSIWSNSLLNKLSYGELSPIHCSHYHLYILSDEKIKEGDWCMSIDKNSKLHKPFQCISKQAFINPEFLNSIDAKDIKKIIATTDTLLKLHDNSGNNHCFGTQLSGNCKHLLPQPSQQFIEHYVAEYNKGNIITKVLVEYEEATEYDKVYNKEKYFPRLKLNPDNTINIKPIILESEVIGEKIVEYCKQYEGTNKYNDVLKAIEFGYQLSIDKNL